MWRFNNKYSRKAKERKMYAKTVSRAPNDEAVASEIENPLMNEVPNRAEKINTSAAATLDSGAAWIRYRNSAPRAEMKESSSGPSFEIKLTFSPFGYNQ